METRERKVNRLRLASFVFASKICIMWRVGHSRIPKSTYRDSLKAMEADIEHANSVAAILPNYWAEECLQLKLSLSPLAPFFFFLLDWFDYNCLDHLLHVLVSRVYLDGSPTMSSHERRASIRDFYYVIYPSLKQIEEEIIRLEDDGGHVGVIASDEECGICMESPSDLVLPSCGHSMCHLCFHKWNYLSESCPFCRGSLKWLSSEDVWMLTTRSEVVERRELVKGNVARFYLYIDGLQPVVDQETSQVLMLDYMI